MSRFRYSDTACVGKEQCCLTAKQHLDTRERQGVGRRCHRIENIKIRYRSFDSVDDYSKKSNADVTVSMVKALT